MLLVALLQGAEQFPAKYSRFLSLHLKQLKYHDLSRFLRLLLKQLKYHELIAEGAGVAGIGRMQSDGVANNSVQIANALWGHIGGWPVVG